MRSPTSNSSARSTSMRRKVGKDLGEAIFAPPNCTTVFQKDVPHTGVTVRMGRVLDGVAEHMEGQGERGFVRADAPEASQAEIVAALKESGAEVLVNFLPVGSRAGDPLLHGMRARGRGGGGQLHAGVHRQQSGVGAALRRQAHPDHRRRHQGATGRDDRPPRPLQPVPGARRQPTTAPISSTPAAIPTS